MNKFIIILISLVILGGIFYLPVSAQVEATTTETFIQSLMVQIEALKTQINNLKAQLSTVKGEQKELKETIVQLRRQLDRGMSGEDVKLLQEALSTDPDIYPEGLTTGYFGPLTERAVKRFQKKVGVEQAGRVGPQTMSRLNQLLIEGNASGKVPPGLLIAPGIRKKFEEWTFGSLPGQKLPPGIAKKLGGGTPGDPGDITPPVISNISVINTATSSAMIIWATNEESDSTIWYDTVGPIFVTDSTSKAVSYDLVLNHEIELFDLTPVTTYYYLVGSADAVGNSTNSSEQTFDTLAE